MVLEYEKMLAESNMTPEEFEELVQSSGIIEIEAEEKRIHEEQQEIMADEYLEMLKDSGLSDEEIEAISKLQDFIGEKIVDLEKKCKKN